MHLLNGIFGEKYFIFLVFLSGAVEPPDGGAEQRGEDDHVEGAEQRALRLLQQLLREVLRHLEGYMSTESQQLLRRITQQGSWKVTII